MSRKPKMARIKQSKSKPESPVGPDRGQPITDTQPARAVVPRQILDEIQSLFKRSYLASEIAWETVARMRIGDIMEPQYYCLGYLMGVCDSLGARVDDVLERVHLPDGSPVLCRERSPRADLLADWLANGAIAGVASLDKTPSETILAWRRFYGTDAPGITREHLPDVVEDDIASAVAGGKIPNDPGILAEYRRGWLFSLLGEMPDPLPARPARAPCAA